MPRDRCEFADRLVKRAVGEKAGGLEDKILQEEHSLTESAFLYVTSVTGFGQLLIQLIQLLRHRHLHFSRQPARIFAVQTFH